MFRPGLDGRDHGSPDHHLLVVGPNGQVALPFLTLAGFVEPGESLEQCLARDVREAVGVEVTDSTYRASRLIDDHAQRVRG